MKAEILSKIEALKVIEETEWDAYKKAEAELDAETMRLQLPPDPLKVLTDEKKKHNDAWYAVRKRIEGLRVLLEDYPDGEAK